MEHTGIRSVEVFTTCPPYRGTDAQAYIAQVAQVSRWSDRAGCRGMLVYTDNGMLDPWLVAQMVVQNTESLMPLVAVQPVYTHPYTLAKAVATLSYLYRRRICLNMVAGGFKNDLAALNDQTPHDRRYDRLVEYTTIILKLLRAGPAVTFEGEFYTVRQLALKPPLPAELFPLLTISGSSPEGLAAARKLDAVPIKYPEPADSCASAVQDGVRLGGIRVGIIAREREENAWRVALERFPSDRAGQLLHQMALNTSDSVWHRQLSELAQSTAGVRCTYWLEPFQNYKTFCPYLVGSYDQAAAEIGRYMALGYRLFVLDVPASEEELVHIDEVFERTRHFVPDPAQGVPA